MSLTRICRDCFTWAEPVPDQPRQKCPKCKGHRLTFHEEIRELTIAHMDCDAFYATVEKRDDPGLRDKPVIIGGGKRGVVSTACYIARLSGVHSAMPMRMAKQLCPEAIVLRGNSGIYTKYSKLVTDVISEAVPLYEKSSIDEFYIDLTGMDHFFGCYQLASELRANII